MWTPRNGSVWIRSAQIRSAQTRSARIRSAHIWSALIRSDRIWSAHIGHCKRERGGVYWSCVIISRHRSIGPVGILDECHEQQRSAGVEVGRWPIPTVSLSSTPTGRCTMTTDTAKLCYQTWPSSLLWTKDPIAALP